MLSRRNLILANEHSAFVAGSVDLWRINLNSPENPIAAKIKLPHPIINAAKLATDVAAAPDGKTVAWLSRFDEEKVHVVTIDNEVAVLRPIKWPFGHYVASSLCFDISNVLYFSIVASQWDSAT